MSEKRATTTLDARFVDCPTCGARLVSRNPLIDSAGFESYSFVCKCGKRFKGIVDPYDEALLIAELDG